MGFWIWILVAVIAIVGASVLVGAAVSNRKPRIDPRKDKVTALKASGALKHRKSNRP